MRQIQAPLWVTEILLAVTSTVGRSVHAESPREPINAPSDLFAALRSCWQPPPLDRAHDGMELTVRFSLARFDHVFGGVGSHL
jgi:hypothetical protein